MSEEDELKSTNYIADLFGVSPRRIQQLTEEGVIEPTQKRPRKYDLIPTVKDYIQFLSDKAYDREKKKVISDLEEQKMRADVAVKEAKAEMEMLKLNELRAIMHRAEDVEAIMTDHVLMLRSMLMAMPGKLAVDLANINNAPEAAERVKQEVYDILNQLASYRYDEEEYKKRVREREGWEEQNESED